MQAGTTTLEKYLEASYKSKHRTAIRSSNPTPGGYTQRNAAQVTTEAPAHPCLKKMQELTDSIKRPNPRTMGIEEGEEVQAKGMRNIFNKIITKNFPNLEKTMPIQV
jgi:hypothetical protein